MTKLVSIACVSANNIIGNGVSQTVNTEGDRTLFRAITMGHPVIMGRRTYQSIGKLFQGRHTIVVTTRKSAVKIPEELPDFTGLSVVGSIGEACGLAHELDPHLAFVAGGGQVYAQTMDLVDGLLITRVPRIVSGTVRYPDIDPTVWTLARTQAVFDAKVNYYKRSLANS